MDIERTEPLPCIAVDFKNRLLLENNQHDPISATKKVYADKIKFELADKETMTMAYSFEDGSIIMFQINQMGVADPQMVFQMYMGAVLREDFMKKPQPDMEKIKKEVVSKIADLKRRTRGDHS